MPISSKYAPLAVYLAALPAETTTVTLTLTEIEAILGDDLPERAGTGAFWVGGRSRPHTVWLAAGWRVARVAMRVAAPTIAFTRMPRDTITPPRAGERP